MVFILPGGLGQIAASSGPPSTLDPATIGGSGTGVLTNGNMTFTAPTAAGNVQTMVSGTRFRNSGKFYFEFQVIQVPGTGSPNQSFGAGVAGSNGSYYYLGGGDVYAITQDNATTYWYTMTNSANVAQAGYTPNVGDALQFALDMTSTSNTRFYMGVNNQWSPGLNPFSASNPSWSGLGAGAGYTYYPTCCVYAGANLASFQFANRSALFSYTPPAGFSPWN